MTALTVMDLFCGTGAFSKGFGLATNAHFHTVFGMDSQSIATRTFQANHPTTKTLSADIRRTAPSKIKDFIGSKSGGVDIIVGGPPCQGFSSIRPYRSDNAEDPRNSLFEDFIRYIDYFRPKYIVMENVVGLATHRQGKTISIIEEHLHRIGYDSDWRILNAANFGIPQKRERLFLIGVERGGNISFPQPTHMSDSPTIGYKERKRMVLPPQRDLFNPSLYFPPAITVMEAIGDLPPLKAGETANYYNEAPSHPFQIARRGNTTSLALHNSTKHSPHMLEIIRHAGTNIHAIPKHLISSGFSSSYSRLAADEPSVTITVNFVHPASNRCIHPVYDRALTPREGARLQSFDDDYIFLGNRSQITKMIGNAVPPLLAKAVAETLASNL